MTDNDHDQLPEWLTEDAPEIEVDAPLATIPQQSLAVLDRIAALERAVDEIEDLNGLVLLHDYSEALQHLADKAKNELSLLNRIAAAGADEQE